MAAASSASSAILPLVIDPPLGLTELPYGLPLRGGGSTYRRPVRNSGRHVRGQARSQKGHEIPRQNELSYGRREGFVMGPGPGRVQLRYGRERTLSYMPHSDRRVSQISPTV